MERCNQGRLRCARCKFRFETPCCATPWSARCVPVVALAHCPVTQNAADQLGHRPLISHEIACPFDFVVLRPTTYLHLQTIVTRFIVFYFIQRHSLPLSLLYQPQQQTQWALSETSSRLSFSSRASVGLAT
jgi:hypothetical protein